MSGFVVGGGRGGPRRVAHLTAAKLFGVLAACLAVTALVALLAPLLGNVTDRSGAHLSLMHPRVLLAPGPADALDHAILWVRVPRVLAALLVGGALAGAGCALQALLRNPLAEPFTLGISSGASLAAVLAIRLGAEAALGPAGVGGAAFVGAAGTLVIVWQLAQVGRQLPPATLVLAGVTMSMLCASASVLIQATSDFAEMSHMLVWMLGGLSSVRLSTVGYAAPPIGVGLLVLLLHARALNALAAGPDVAASLGVAVRRTQTIVFFVTSLLVGAAIAVCGPIGFVGLIVPHALRALIGPDHRLLLPASIFGGGVLLALCDTLARIVIPGNQLPTGAVTAVLGAVFFLGILVAAKRRAGMWA